MTRRALVLIALVATTALARAYLRPMAATVASSLAQVPMVVGTWQGSPSADFRADVLAQLHVDDLLNRRYVTPDGDRADLYVGYYRSQAQGAAIHSPLNCLPGAGWAPVRADRVAFADGTARRVLIEKGRRRLLVMYWYQSSRRVEGDEYRSRVFTAFDTIRDHRNDAAIVRVIVPVNSADAGELQAVATAGAFAAAIEPYVRRVLFPATDQLRHG